MTRNMLLCTAMAFILHSQARADLITYKFTGSTAYFRGMQGADSFQGQFTYDTSVLDTSPADNSWDEYPGSLVDFRMQSGAFSYQLANHAEVRRLTFTDNGANLYVGAFEWVDLAHAASSNDLHNIIDVLFRLDPSVFVPGSLPTKLKLGQSKDYDFSIQQYWALSATSWGLFGKFETLERAPEPASIMLLSSSLAGLLFFRKRFTRNE